MSVAELIKELRRMPQDAEVRIDGPLDDEDIAQVELVTVSGSTHYVILSSE